MRARPSGDPRCPPATARSGARPAPVPASARPPPRPPSRAPHGPDSLAVLPQAHLRQGPRTAGRPAPRPWRGRRRLRGTGTTGRSPPRATAPRRPGGCRPRSRRRRRPSGRRTARRGRPPRGSGRRRPRPGPAAPATRLGRARSLAVAVEEAGGHGDPAGQQAAGDGREDAQVVAPGDEGVGAMRSEVRRASALVVPSSAPIVHPQRPPGTAPAGRRGPPPRTPVRTGHRRRRTRRRPRAPGAFGLELLDVP